MNYDMIDLKAAARLWKLSDRRVNEYCKEGRIEGAHKEGNKWVIPAGAEKPEDRRYKENGANQVLQEGRPKRKRPLPIGVSGYVKASSDYYYVDKTMLIKELLEDTPKVTLFTRPRRFGKTLNMDMLRVFFEISKQDTSIYFKDKKIWQCGEEYTRHQGKYPVIYLTFKDVKYKNWEMSLESLADLIQDEFGRHKELLESDKLDENDKELFRRFRSGEADESQLSTSLNDLAQMLYQHYGTAPILIIDEYDTPIHQGFMRGFYDDVITFMRIFFSSALKDNPNISFAFMTGILRVAKESIFSVLNNLTVDTVLDDRYSEYFGFTKKEVEAMCEFYDASEKYEELCEWYDGYHFGNTEIFNPWSLINYFFHDCKLDAYWISTSSNDIIAEILSHADEEIEEMLKTLLQGQSVTTYIDTSIIYPDFLNEPSSIFSFLLVTGYLNVIETESQFGGRYVCRVAIPNKEISYVYSKEVLYRYRKVIPEFSGLGIHQALLRGDVELLQENMKKLLMRSISYNDAASEAFYHGLILGLCALMDNRYYVTSNRESGKGRFDIQLMPIDKRLPGMLLELKAAKDADEEKLKKLAQDALVQIDDMSYETEMNAHDVKDIQKYGIAFCGKDVEIAMSPAGADAGDK